MRYAFVSDYIKAVNALNMTWPVFTGELSAKFLLVTIRNLTEISDDFFPYMDGDHSYWSGYYSSKPVYKNNLRQADARLQATEVILKILKIQKFSIQKLRVNLHTGREL